MGSSREVKVTVLTEQTIHVDRASYPYGYTLSDILEEEARNVEGSLLSDDLSNYTISVEIDGNFSSVSVKVGNSNDHNA